MQTPSYGNSDPIFAVATALAESALALIRVSGGALSADNRKDETPGAIQLLAEVFSKPKKILNAPPGSIVHGWIRDPGPETSGATNKRIDEVLVSLYRAPRSYTGEDGADISCHGGIAVVKAVMAALKKAGFREALPGEFTFRAFMNGKLDLTRAESVMELVAAKTHKGREQAVRRLAGVLETEISAIKAQLVEVLAAAEIYLDYSEDEFINPSGDEEAGRLPERKLAEQAVQRLKNLAELWQRERIYAEGALAVLAGRPNAGKSSLFNYLIREDRSIVTEWPGTTRDWIDALISLEGIPLRLADTAGLEDPGSGDPGPRSGDIQKTGEAERIGMRRSLELLEKADLVLYVIDGTVGIQEEDRKFLLSRKEAAPEKPILVIWNKTDLTPPNPGAVISAITGTSASEMDTRQFIAASAKTGEGIPALVHSMAGLLGASQCPQEATGQDAAGPGSIRQKELIDTALASVEEALDLADREAPLDIIAPLFRTAINALGEITGEVSNAEILETMFSRFCVGK